MRWHAHVPGLGLYQTFCSAGLLQCISKCIVNFCAHADVYLPCGLKVLHFNSPVIRLSLAGCGFEKAGRVLSRPWSATIKCLDTNGLLLFRLSIQALTSTVRLVCCHRSTCELRALPVQWFASQGDIISVMEREQTFKEARA